MKNRIEYDEVVDLGIHPIHLGRTYHYARVGVAEGYRCLLSDNAKKALEQIYKEKISTDGSYYKETSYKFILLVNHSLRHSLVRDPTAPPKKLFKLRGKMRVASTLALIELKAKGVLDLYFQRWDSFDVLADNGRIECHGGSFNDANLDSVIPSEHFATLYWVEA